MSYADARTPAQKAADLNGSRAFESQVHELLSRDPVISRTLSTTDLDFAVPRVVWVEVKEKRQRLNRKWVLHEGVPERDHFVLDELSLRKAVAAAPYCYFVLRDVPGGDRIFLASVFEVACGDRVRRLRSGKSKLILRLDQYRRVALPDLPEAIAVDIAHEPWKGSGALSQLTVPEI